MKRILVTGGTGFIGSHCLQLLADYPHEIFATYRDIDDTFKHDRINWIPLDLAAHDRVYMTLRDVQPTHLLHLAWTMSTGMKLNSPVHHHWFNTSRMLVRAFREHGGKRMVITGTGAEYGVVNEICVERHTPLHPDTDYGRSKKELFKWVEDYGKRWSVSYGWGRVFFLYGPGEKPNRFIPYVISSMLSGDVVKTTYARQVQDYLYVEDGARALIKLLFSKYQGPINICSGSPIQLSDIIERIAHLIPGDHKIIFGAKPSSPHDYQFLVGDGSLLRKELDFVPRYELKTGLMNSIGALKKKKVFN